ncbi:MAG: YdcF family protein [Caldilineae bacterium]|nr:MAG: YdcF family protein [Caldilineae bacterium]
MGKVFTIFIRGFGIVLVGAGALGLILAWQVDRAGAGDPLVATDAVVVMGAQVRANGEPGPDLWTRTRTAAALYHELAAQGKAPALITTGGYANSPSSAAAVARRKAMEWGVPAQHIWLADGTKNTEEDAQAAAALMARNGWRSVTVVSHPLHLFRSRWYFQRAGVVEVHTFPAGSRARLPIAGRIYLSSREAAAVVWELLGGWERAEPLGRFLKQIVYHQRG